MSKRIRKYGRPNYRFRRRYLPVNLERLQLFVDSGKIDPNKKIDMKVMFDTGLVQGKLNKTYLHGVKLLASGKEWFAAKNLDIEVSKASKSAMDIVGRNGGKVKEVYYHRLYLKKKLRNREELGPPQEYKLGRDILDPFKVKQIEKRKFGEVYVKEQELVEQELQRLAKAGNLI